MVLAGPASPLETTTTTPAATAASLNCLTASTTVSGSGLEPKDSLITFTWSVLTAYSMAWRKLDVVESSFIPNTSSPTRDAPGATPSIRTLQAEGSAWA